jgi:hypothetical protein
MVGPYPRGEATFSGGNAVVVSACPPELSKNARPLQMHSTRLFHRTYMEICIKYQAPYYVQITTINYYYIIYISYIYTYIYIKSGMHILINLHTPSMDTV